MRYQIFALRRSGKKRPTLDRGGPCPPGRGCPERRPIRDPRWSRRFKGRSGLPSKCRIRKRPVRDLHGGGQHWSSLPRQLTSLRFHSRLIIHRKSRLFLSMSMPRGLCRKGYAFRTSLTWGQVRLESVRFQASCRNPFGTRVLLRHGDFHSGGTACEGTTRLSFLIDPAWNCLM